jgi:HlyD family secretion protein
LTLALVAALVAGGLYYWLAGRDNGPHYRTDPVERGEITQKVLATGTVNPVTLVQVGSQVSGTIAALYADFNSRVKRGQVVAQIDPAIFQAEVSKARANYQSAQAEVAKGQAEVVNAELMLKRMKVVRERDLVSQAEVDDAQTKYDTARAGLEAARARVALTKAALELAETNLRYSTIRSPVDGIVVDRQVDVGQTVAASFQAPVIFKIAADLAKMQVDTAVDEADVGRVRLGQGAAFTVDAYPGVDFQGRVVQVRNAPQQVQNVVTYDVVLNVDNRDLLLKPGMTANVAIITAVKPDVLKVPNAALRFTPQSEAEGKDGAGGGQPQPAVQKGSQQKVWVLGASGQPKAVPVTVGITDGVSSELTGGKLSQGEQVIVEQVEEPGQTTSSKPQPRLF